MDPFTDDLDPVEFAHAVEAAVHAFTENGFTIEVEVRAEVFARALLAVDRWPDREYTRYGLNPERVDSMRSVLRAWAADIGAD